MALWLRWMEINADAFTCCVHHALRRLHRLEQAHAHADMKHPKAREAAGGVRVWVPEKLLPDAFAHFATAQLRPRIDDIVFGLHDEESRLGLARGQLRADRRGQRDDASRVARFEPIFRPF